MQEIWKVIPEYESLYEVSNKGNVRTLGNFPKLRNKVVGNLKPGKCRGYNNVILTTHEGVRKTYLIHRLVAQSFLPNPLNLPHINHIDEDKDNNAVENLQWCTPQYNKEYSSSKTYRLLSPSGIEVEVFNMSKFCRDNNLAQGNMANVVTGKRNHHKGWSLAL